MHKDFNLKNKKIQTAIKEKESSINNMQKQDSKGSSENNFPSFAYHIADYSNYLVAKYFNILIVCFNISLGRNNCIQHALDKICGSYFQKNPKGQDSELNNNYCLI